MANYYMQGGDGKEYGPATAQQLRQWVAEGRANAQTVVRDTAGGPYVALGAVPELNAPEGSGQTQAQAAPTPTPAPSFAASSAPSEYFMRGGDGKEYGPVTAQQLRQWMAEGRANAQTMVRDTAGGPYLAVGMVPDLYSAPAARPTVANLPLAQALAQNAAMGGVDEGAQVKRLASVLAAGSGWIKFMAVLMFISGGLQVLSIWGIVIAWIPIWLGVTLWGAASKAEHALMLGSESELSASLEKLRFYFKLNAILFVVMIVVLVLFLFLAVALGISTGLGRGMGGMQ